MAVEPMRRGPAPPSPFDLAKQTQAEASALAERVADQIIEDYRVLVARAGDAFSLTAADPGKRELLRTIHAQGLLNLKGR